MAKESVEAPMTGRIISVDVKTGDVVKEDDAICVLEAMKMEMPIVAPVGGTVTEIKVSKGQAVNSGDVLAIIEH